MASSYYCPFFYVIVAALIVQGVEGSRAQKILYHQTHQISTSETDFLHLQGVSKGWMINEEKKNSRRMMIGSVAPTCTYNECRGCRYKCRAEQVPVEGNDPVNSPYHYKCVCHR